MRTITRLAATALLIAPLNLSAADITISSAATSNVTFSGGVFTGSAALAGNINVTTLTNALATGNVTVRAVPGSGNGDITVASNVSWAAATTLRLEAVRNVALNAGTAITSSGGGPIQLRADSSGTGVGTIIGTGTLSGPVTIFYNPLSFTTPSNFGANLTSGSLTAYMLVNTLNNLQNISTNLSGSYALGRNIDASATAGMNSGAGFIPIGTAVTRFTGIFNGDGNIIDSLYINRPAQDFVGLFGAVSGATITDVELRNVSITGGTATGALIGGSLGSSVIARTSSSGVVTTTGSNGGGLIGTINQGSVSVSRSSATVVSAGSSTQGIGGLIGSANAFSPNALSIINAYATGAVIGGTSGAVGGLIGFNNNTSSVINTYSAGVVTSSGGNVGGLIGFNNVATVVNSFWDTQASGLASSSGGTAQTTAQMRQQATFTGWDFATIWRIVEGQTYPFFASATPPVVTTSAGTTAFVEADGPGGIPVAVDSTLTVSDDDNPTLVSAEVSIGTGFQSAEDLLMLVNDAATMGNITGTYTSATGVLGLTSAGGTATVAQWQAALRAVTYLNTSNAPNTTTRTIRFAVSDGTSSSTKSDKLVSVTATNDTPQIFVPATLAVTEDVPSTISGISFYDPDAAGVTATLSVPSGAFLAISLGGVVVAGSGFPTLTLTGTIANINAFMASGNVVFLTAPNATANVTLTTTITAGGTAATTLQVTAVNDPPSISAPASVAVTEDVATAVSGISVADVDATSVTVTFSVPSGTLSTTSMSGTIASINAQLAGGALTFTTAADSNASVPLSISIDDGAGGSAAATVTLLVTAVNDAPVNSVPGAQSTAQDVPLALTGLVSVSDIDSATVTVTIAATNGSVVPSNVSGTLAAVNTALASLTFTPAAGFSGAASLTITTDDGALTDTDAIAITVSDPAPSIASVTVPPGGTYVAGDTLAFTVIFNENVIVTGAPSIPLTIGTSVVHATYVSGSGTNTLLFQYDIAPGDADLDGIAVGSAIALNGGTIHDAGGNNAPLVLVSVPSTAQVLVAAAASIPALSTMVLLALAAAMGIVAVKLL